MPVHVVDFDVSLHFVTKVLQKLNFALDVKKDTSKIYKSFGNIVCLARYCEDHLTMSPFWSCFTYAGL